MPHRLNTCEQGFEDRFQAIIERTRSADDNVDVAVREIIREVRTRGDHALIELTRKFDKLTLTSETMRVPEEDSIAAYGALSDDLRAALHLAADRIRAFHKAGLPGDVSFDDDYGSLIAARWRAVDSAGIYVPGGLASYPSSVLMNAIPAKVAGVERVAMVVPHPGGEVNPVVLAAAHICGVDEIYKVGGAQAVAALAYGTETIAPVDVITGPGNAYVAEAKRQVFGRVGIDMIAGPSEILIVADADNNAEWVAADLLSQAEHDRSAQSILITNDESFANQVIAQVEAQLPSLPKVAIAEASWDRHGLIIIVESFDAALPLIDQLAAEHVEILLPDAAGFAAKIRHAGSIFLGPYTPEAIGDYVGGPNHVLPTGRRARFSSGLSAVNFMKRTTLLGVSKAALGVIGPAAETLALSEGLAAHARSVTLRLDALARDE
ncbi:MAG: histidinol dehydrogenase [Pseudomonadota bacterium]